MTGSVGNSDFCFPSTPTFPSAWPRGTLRENKFPIFLGASLKSREYHSDIPWFWLGSIQSHEAFTNIDRIVCKQKYFMEYYIKLNYYIASSVSEWTESCAVVGYPSGKDCVMLPPWDDPLFRARKRVFFSHIINPLLSKLVRSRWLDIDQVYHLPWVT